jgi:hypothetical protein
VKPWTIAKEKSLMARARARRLIVLVAAALTLAACCASAPVASASVGPRQIDAFLLAHDSPLVGEGEAFYAAGERNGVDPAFLVAISGAESSFGNYLFSAGSQTASHNAFNWFYAATRAGSAFGGWEQAIDTVATGLRGSLYYGAGRYAVGDIAPIYCPQGTQAWVANVTAYMLELGADPSDTRWRGTSLTPAVRARTKGEAPATLGAHSALIVRRPLTLTPATVAAGARVRIRFTLVNEGPRGGVWKGVILRLEGPSGQTVAFGSHAPLRLRPGASYSFEATARPRESGVWRGWVDVEAQDGAILTGARPQLRIVVAPAATKRRRAAA